MVRWGKIHFYTFLTLESGGTWKPLVPPKEDSQGRRYECDSAVRNVTYSRCTSYSFRLV
jgi:hypothetical protein